MGRDLAGAVVQTAGEVVGLPGVGLGVTLLQYASQRRAQKRAHDFFSHLGVAIGCADADAAAQEIAKSMNQEWAQEAIDRGFRLMMGAVDDAAKPCIAVLVAEYYMEKRSPDRHFQRVGTLLMDSVFRDLSLVRGFCDCVKQLSAMGSPADRVFVRDNASPNIFLIAAQGAERPRFKSRSFVGFDRGMRAVSLLTRHGLGDLWTGPGSVHLGGTPLLKFGARSDPAYLLLGKSLTVLGDGA